MTGMCVTKRRAWRVKDELTAVVMIQATTGNKIIRFPFLYPLRKLPKQVPTSCCASARRCNYSFVSMA